MSRPLVTEHRTAGVSVITRDRAPVNALTLETTRQLNAALRAAADATDVRAIVMTGAGTKSFGAGSDIAEFGDLITSGRVVEDKMAFENETFSLLGSIPKPTIAALNGSAFGGGLEIALACDLIVAEAGQVVGFPEIKLGLFPGSGGPVRALRRIGEARTKELVFLGDPIPVETALDWGLINRVVPAGTAVEFALEWAQRLAQQSASGLRAGKAAVNDALRSDEGEQAIRHSLDYTRTVFAHPDAVEGAAAFLAKRAPMFPSAAADA
jgi:enoyl-CoA hydratase/carnithine racemase